MSKSNKVKLGVNIDHIASIRNLRKGVFPSPVDAARIAEKAGACGITVHLREDRRHINDEDVKNLKKSLKTKLNLEMSISPGIVKIAESVIPEDVCLVPEKRQELTTEGGLDVAGNKKKIAAAVARLKKKGIRVSLFIDPVFSQIKASKEVGADFVELHTGKYADAKTARERQKEFLKIKKASGYVLKLKLGLNAGHGLDYGNVSKIAKIRGMKELNIGYSIICRAVYAGLFEAVREMNELVSR